jgi:hypothetical protein
VADWYAHNVGEFPWFVNEKFGARGFPVPFDDDVQVGAVSTFSSRRCSGTQ